MIFRQRRIKVGTEIIEIGIKRLDPILKLLNGWFGSMKLRQARMVGISKIVFVNTPKLYDFYMYKTQT